MSNSSEIDFNLIVNDILKNDKFINLKYERHHGISRMDHSLHVARITFLACKKMHVEKIEEVTRAALLHDFFVSSEINKRAFIAHPELALKNACTEFALNDMQKNIIESHMFPVSVKMPKCKESFLVSLIDKIVSVYEMMKYKIPIELGAILLFVINFLAIQRYL